MTFPLAITVTFCRDGAHHIERYSFQTGVGFDWTYKEKNSFSGSLTYNQFGNTGSGIINQSQQTHAPGGSILSDIISLSNMDNTYRSHNVDANLTYKRTFNKEDQELEIQATTSLGNSFSASSNNQWLLPNDSLYYGTNNKNPGTQNLSEVQMDYTQPLKKDVLLGVGGKLNFMDITSTSDILSLQPASKLFLPNSALSNYLDYHQKVYALYSELIFPVAHLFDTKIGGRYERTEITSFYSNAQKPETTPGYNTFVPSVYFSKKISDNQMVKLSYSKRIERPDYGDLNPFINTADPKNITAGNPYLQPEVGNRYELGYSRDFGATGSVMANLFYRANNHDIQPYIVYYPTLKIGDSTYTNVSVSSRENIGLENNMGVNLFGDIHLATKLTVRTNLFLFYRHITNMLDPGYNAHSFNYRLNMNADYEFSNTLAGEFFGNFNSPRNEVQGRYPSFVTYSFAFRKQFWNKKGSLALTATNPFNEYVNQRTEVFGPNFTLSSNRKIPFRSFGINFTWKFGKLEFKKDKEEDLNLTPPIE